MAGQRQNWGRLSLLVIFSLVIFTEPFKVRDEDWEELGPDIAALHRLRGLAQHMFHERLKEPSNQRDTSVNGAQTERSIRSVDTDQNPMSLLDGFQECQDFTACVNQSKQDLDTFLASIDEQKIQDQLLGASEISHSYSQKLLVMADNEKSTNDRVQQDYSMDPHYSVIVTKECLYNESCLPEADSYTVVKIFGRVSDDGQTVSELSGSSLAELMLKVSLKAAPVFSIDGNTTTDFQHDFIRMFMVRGIRAVLETSQGNHQIYQAMDKPGSVSSYQIPQRPIDHTTQYDHQQILMMEDDPVVRKAATYLYEKHPTVSSVYVLDENQRPKLVFGDSVPLSESSRLVLVGHGLGDSSGEMRLSGKSAQEVAEIIAKTSRVSDTIKTTSVVSCQVGSDKAFVQTLLTELHSLSIKTELHLRDGIIQVTHTGQKITMDVSKEGETWRHKDDSMKVVATLDRNGDVIIRNEPGGRGEAVFTNERNVLGKNRKQTKRATKIETYRDNWPDKPKTFVDQNVFQRFDSNEMEIKQAIDTLEAMAWGFFHPDQPPPKKIIISQEELRGRYVIQNMEKSEGKKGKDQENALFEYYEIESGEDVRNVIRHYARTGENRVTYLMVNGWIYSVDPKSLYVHLVGKKLDNNMNNNEVKRCINAQKGKESYTAMRQNINTKASREQYAKYVRSIFLGEHPTIPSLSTEASYTTYFTASVICESIRNFRTFPLVLMALEMVITEHETKALNFLFDDHPMARGGSWIDPDKRGFSGSAKPKGFSESETMKLMEVLSLESAMFKTWMETTGGGAELMAELMAEMMKTFKIFEDSSNRNIFLKGFNDFTHKVQQPSTDDQRPSTSGALGGYEDGSITMKDLNSASELENSFKLESYYSRASASFAEEIHSQLKAKYGENLAGLHFKEGSARIEKGQFSCQLVPEDADVEPVEFKVDLSPESQRYSEILLKGIETAVHDMETHTRQPFHQVSKYVEHMGTAAGTLGLMLGMKGAVRAFEQGDIKDGVMGSLQTAHGVTAMTSSVIAKQALSSETRIGKATAAIMKNSAMDRMMVVLPIAGIGFGIYNVEQDLARGDTVRYIDASIDESVLVLDVVEYAQPELAPIIAPINLALSVVRMTIDDVYMGIQNELNSLPKDAGVLDKLRAVFVGFGKGVRNFGIHVASFFYDWHYEEIEEGRRLVAQISDYHKYYTVTQDDYGTTAIDFSHSESSWNGGGIYFCLADQGPSEFCINYFVSTVKSFGKRCWNISAEGGKDIILGLGESHQLEYKTLQKKVLMFIPAGSVEVVSDKKAVSDSRYGTYRGNRDANRLFAVQKSEDNHMIDLMLTYYYQLYGEPGDDTFFLGPQRSYVEGSSGKDTYIIPDNGGKTIIHNYDPSKALDTLHFSVDYSQISVSKSGNDVVLMYKSSHTVTIQNWFLGEAYRHMNMMSGDGVLFEISSTVISSAQLVARGINKMFKTSGETIDASQSLLHTVTNIFGTRYDDVLIGNGERNVIDGAGGDDCLIGGEGEDIYLVKNRNQSSVKIDNYSRDNKTDLVIIEANLHTFEVSVAGNDVQMKVLHDRTAIHVTLLNWFRSPEDRHLLVITKDLITFRISDNRADCLQRDPFTKCIKSQSIDYSSSTNPLVVDLQEDKAFNSVTEVRGSEFNDVIKGNKEHNVFVPGRGDDFIQGRGGEDWYVITPGQGVKTINNQSPDLALDVLLLKEQYQKVTCACEGQSIVISVSSGRTVILQNWFDSKHHQHLQIKTSDGVTAGLMPNLDNCSTSLMLPLTVDYRNQKPEPLNVLPEFQSLIVPLVEQSGDFTYRGDKRSFLNLEGKGMIMNATNSVREMYGSPGFDIMVGNSNENLLDPYTGGALMIGGEGKDTYTIKRGYGEKLLIGNFAEDQKIDTVFVDMDFIDGSQVTLDSSSSENLSVKVTTKGEQFQFTLLKYTEGSHHQHLEFQSSDGVKFKLKSLSTTDAPLFVIEAFKVTLKQSEVDCHLDLSSHRNLSKVQTVQGCPFQSNNILGNDYGSAITGGWEDDVLEGGQGDDTLIGGNGSDLLIGGLGDDTFYGEDGNDTMIGDSGSDVFFPGPGADLMDGGPGRDSVLYQGDHKKGKGVFVNLLTGQGRNADAEGDVLKDVENVIGTIYSDILVSGYESSLLKGSDGNDILVSTGGDYLVGDNGNDIYMLAFHHGSVTIDNCAKDNATDVLYLSSKSSETCDCEVFSDRVLLTFFGLNQNTVKITLKGWIGDDSECGHLELVFREVKVSVHTLLQECQLRQRGLFWSSVITSATCVIIALLLCVFMLLMCGEIIERAQQQKTLKQSETNVNEEAVAMNADVDVTGH